MPDSDQLAYVLITPYSLRKSRTGGIISRLISRSGLELVSGRMFSPSLELVQKFAELIVTESDERHRKTQELIRDYVLNHFAPSGQGEKARVLMLILRGQDSVKKVLDVAGHIVHSRTSGETIRDTFGDYVTDSQGRPTYFEPAVIVPPTVEMARQGLKLWAQYSDDDGGILTGMGSPEAEGKGEQTLVLIKPDNFRFPNARPGGVIDTFSQTGLSIIGFKVHHMSVDQARQFYGPVLEVLTKVFQEPCAKRAKLALEAELGVPIPEAMERQLGEMLGPICGKNHWETIVQFMSGTRPSDCSADRLHAPGTEKCVALVYEGPDAVKKIRQVLGPTDPAKAPPGSIRREFGQTVMINAAHASDSAENAQREMAIIEISDNNLKPLIESYFQSK